jgi:hypothetical protein
LIPLLAVTVLDQSTLDLLPGFRKRMDWFLANRHDLHHQISMMEMRGEGQKRQRLLALPMRGRLLRLLSRLLDEREFLSPFGIRSLSAAYAAYPFVLVIDGEERAVHYDPGESTTGLFGGNSNWRGPIWLPLNYMFMEALERYHHFYGDDFKVECPTGSGTYMTLLEAAREINRRLCRLFLPDSGGRAPWQGENRIFADDPHWRGLTCFHEYFHAETGRGCGASHQTGWTALIMRCLEDYLNRTAPAVPPTGSS